MRLPIQPEKSRMTMFPLWISEVALAFLAGVLSGVVKIPFRYVTFVACIVFVFGVMIDPILIPAFMYDMPFLIVGNALVCSYLVLGWAIYDAK